MIFLKLIEQIEIKNSFYKTSCNSIKRHFLFVVLLFFAFNQLAAQDNRGFEVTKIEFESGITLNKVSKKLYLDDEKQLWFTAPSNAINYFGKTNDVYEFNAGSYLVVSKIFDVLYSKSNHALIYAFNNSDLFLIDTKTEESRWLDLKYSSDVTDVVLSIKEGNNNHFYFITKSSLLVDYNIETNKQIISKIPLHSNYKINNVSKDNNVLLNSEEHLYLFDNGNFKMLYEVEDKNNKILLLPGDVVINKEKKEYTHLGNTYKITYNSFVDKFILEVPKNINLYLDPSYKNFKNKIDFVQVDDNNPKELKFFRFLKENNTLVDAQKVFKTDSPIKDFIFYKHNKFIVSTETNILKVKKENDEFTNYKAKDKAQELISSYNIVRSFVKKNNEELIVATHNGLINFNEKTNNFNLINLKPLSFQENSSLKLRSLCLQNDSILWNVGEDYFLSKINLKENKIKKYSCLSGKAIRGEENMNHVVQLSKKELLIATNSGVLSFNTENNVFKDVSKLSKDISLEDTKVYYLLVDKQKIYYGTGKGLFVKDRKTNEVKSYSTTSKIRLQSDLVYVLHRDLSGKIQIGTNYGVAILDEEKNVITYLDESNGLSQNRVVGILENAKTIWYSTYGGLTAVDKSSGQVFEFFRADGVSDNEFNHQSFFKSNDSTFYFGTIKGFIKFNPSKHFLNKQIEDSNEIYVRKVEFYDPEINKLVSRKIEDFKDKKVTIPFSKNHITLFLAATDLVDTDKVNFEYKIEGYHEKWQDNHKSQVISILGVPEGENVLKVRSEGFTKANNVIKFNIKVEKIFYKKTGFIVLVFVLFILFLFFGFYNQKRKQKAALELKNKMKTLESKALRSQLSPHFIFNTLNGLQSVLILKGEKVANKYISSFSSLINYTMLLSQVEKISLKDEIKYLRSYTDLQILRNNADINVIINVFPKDLDLDQHFIPSMLIQPVVENSFIHGLLPKKSGEKNIKIDFHKKQNSVICIIEDSGIGRDSSLKKESNIKKLKRTRASDILKERINVLNYLNDSNKNKISYSIEDLFIKEAPSGTRVILEMPIDNKEYFQD